MRTSCRECHFLAKVYRDPGTSVEHVFSLSPDERRKAPEGLDHYSLNCHMGVWDAGLGLSREEQARQIDRTDRAHACFFLPCRPAMLFPAAKELQRRSVENAQMRRTNIYAVAGLWIAALGLVASVVISIISMARGGR